MTGIVDEVAVRLARAAEEEFVALSGVPHPSGRCEGMRDYLLAWARSRGLACGCDGDDAAGRCGNVWIDVPAAPGFEDRPKVIVQAHMDMVCVADPGVDVDFATQPVELVREGDLLTARGTTLGADDGAGLAFGLALAGSGEGHGPLRILATYDEETTMAGAEGVSADVLDADYVVNIDDDVPGEVVVSSAGVLEGTFAGRFALAPVEGPNEEGAGGEAVVAAELEGFAGGHSGGEIHRGRVNAIDELCDALAALVEAGVPVRIASLEGGSASNAIPAQARVLAAVPAALAGQARALLRERLAHVVAAHPDEDGRCSVAPCDAGAVLALTAEASASLLGLVRGLPRGVLAMSPVVEGLVQTSNNLGTARVEGGTAAFTVAARSCEDADLAVLLARFEGLAAAHGMEFRDPLTIPAWPARADNRLADALLEGFARAGLDAQRAAVHGGLEPSWFCRIKPGLQMVSCGPRSWGAHSTDETMDLSSFPAFAAGLLYALQNV